MVVVVPVVVNVSVLLVLVAVTISMVLVMLVVLLLVLEVKVDKVVLIDDVIRVVVVLVLHQESSGVANGFWQTQTLSPYLESVPQHQLMVLVLKVH